ncbi:MAG: lactonase family protein, partial [Capnocytophaga sp.]|nr:lactonase family protein [Capnocytophaga sp.]
MQKSLLLLSFFCVFSCKQPIKNSYTLIVGTYTDTGSKGIYTFDFDAITADFSAVSLHEVDNPSFMTITADGRFIYSVSENEANTSSVNTIGLSGGMLSAINRHRVYADWPCHIVMDENKRIAIASNYGGGSISVHHIDENKHLTDTVQYIQFPSSETKKSHAHSAQFSPDGNHLFVADLGNDSIFKFDLTKNNGTYQLQKSENGSIGLPLHTGPRHFKFSKNGNYMYALGEYSGKVHVYSYGNGQLTEIQSVMTDDVPAGGSADLHISPDGNFLYASNRLENDGIAIFSIDENSGKLTKIGYQMTGKHPRNFRISPNGKWLLVACRDDNEIQIFTIGKDGLLTDSGKRIALEKPVYLEIVESG